ncbi:aquaporin sip2.1, putative [Ricinus communis]|uniref:Aquaporin sip2.1, putative n=1 Tax=Ricinus communis TaxID=3988 RepID=B9SCG0_RICCO|nr:aquaporin sip2.1, putative [Ricinus communis]|eukprot:XP_002523679.1 probable aquaporin SIP2-1 [Ricinus communis]
MGGGVTGRLIISDFVIAFMWVWSGALIKMFVNGVLRMGHEPSGEVLKSTLSIINMFFFAFLGKISKGAAYNPLTIFSSAISGDFSQFLLTVGARIPAQVIGSITGVTLVIQTFPEIGFGPRLNVDIHRGALTEGLLTFAIVTISLGLARKIPGSFFMKTWISSVSKLTLHILGSDLTGGVMNPASVMGWAYARGDHITKEHILVYWLAPVEATLLAVWTFKLLVRPTTQERKENLKGKSD